MSKKTSESTKLPKERAYLVGVEIHNQVGLLSLDDSIAELVLLADTAGLEVVGISTQKLDAPHADTFIGSGKIQEIKALSENESAQVIIFDNELSPRHQRELEKEIGDNIRVLDRTALILDIFAQHASTREGYLQVELAQNEYRMPRLTRAWTHLARQAGGGGGRAGSVGGVGLRGPGETQLEVDRREIHRRITKLKEEIEKVRTQRQQHRVQRKRSRIPVVALVGYTNAGKSTLLNKLTKSDVYVANQLFATLDPTTRRVELPGGHAVLFTDTVGFIQKLPTQLVAAFRATLEEIAEADLLLHVVDINHPNALSQWKSVQGTLKDIEADHIPYITVLNKIDCLPDPAMAQSLAKEFPNACAISAVDGTGISDMIRLVENQLYEHYETITVQLPYQEGQLISLFHEMGQILNSQHTRTGVIMHGQIPGRLLAQFKPFIRTDKIIEDEETE
ncbi:MAG: GTPase HflX [Anaerolineaceae bacterium]|nr:GTPase HflX [Anaerolineaceae bacterium]